MNDNTKTSKSQSMTEGLSQKYTFWEREYSFLLVCTLIILVAGLVMIIGLYFPIVPIIIGIILITLLIITIEDGMITAFKKEGEPIIITIIKVQALIFGAPIAVLCLAIKYFMALKRQCYIPLTPKELQIKNISTIREYFEFINNLRTYKIFGYKEKININETLLHDFYDTLNKNFQVLKEKTKEKEDVKQRCIKKNNRLRMV